MRVFLAALLATLAWLSCGADAASYFPSYSDYAGKPYTATYNKRAILLNDSPVVFMSGSVHYPRFSEGQWSNYLQLAKSEGLNMIEIYVFWNGHEPVEGEFNWSGRYNLTKFLDEVADAGLFANLRIGPYVCAEWNLGGIPTWLQFNRPGIRFRSYEQQWRDAVQKWVGTVIDVTREYFADHGGPIVLAQIENELNGADKEYVQWNGDMANAFNVNVPWIMCNGQSANNTINTCNGNDCAGFLSTHGQSGRILLDQPALWTENEMWFQSWGDRAQPLTEGSNRTSEDVAFTVARWYARGGSHHNYYMYFGGNNFGRDAGGGVATYYANGANHNADGLPNEPRYTHMNHLHALIAELSEDLVTNDAQLDHAISLPYRTDPKSNFTSGTQQLAFVYGSNLVFIESAASVWLQTQYNNQVFDMAPNSIIVLRSGSVYWNSSDVKPVVSSRVYNDAFGAPFTWEGWTEPVFTGGNSIDAAIPITVAGRPLEQLNLTRDMTDYLWYSTKINVAGGSNIAMTIDAATGEAFQLFIDGAYVGESYDASHSWVSSPSQLKITIPSLTAGVHTVSLLSSALGNQNGMEANEDPLINHQQGVNIGGNVTIGGVDITHREWQHRPYLVGESLEIFRPSHQGRVKWVDASSVINQPVTWFTTTFPAVSTPTSGQFSILLDTNGLQRGHAFINGRDIGRFWDIEGGKSGQPTQRYYQIPNDWLTYDQGKMNTLTVVDTLGAVDLDTVRIVTSQIVYGQAAEKAKIVEKISVASS